MRITPLTTGDLKHVAQAHSARLTSAQLAERMGVHRNTVRNRMCGKRFSKAGPDGKWAMADVIAWEQNGSD